MFEFAADFNRCRGTIDQVPKIRPNLTEGWPTSTSGPNNFGLESAQFEQSSANFGAMSADIDQFGPRVGQSWTNIG